MLQSIGLMIGMYILTRMIEIGDRPGRGVVVFIFCALTFVVTALCMVSILAGGAPPMPQ